MACILKIPSEDSKGVVSFTTQERDRFILKDVNLQKRINSLKDRWVIGLHHNWHDFRFSYNPLFDFSMAGEADLVELEGQHVPLVTLDACNFSPKDFKFSSNEKFWDILYVARAVFFKKIPEFFNIIRALYDQGKFYRVLLISPIPEVCKINADSETAFCNIREVYDEMFSPMEQEHFTLLTINYRYPFPFDMPTLAHFYQSSKVFVHSADDERRCRVAGYAWATGLPVVCMNSVASLLPKHTHYKPLVYKAESYDQFPDLIDEAISFVNGDLYTFDTMLPAIKETSDQYTVDVLRNKLTTLCSDGESEVDISLFNLKNLDIRLGRHHGLGNTPNSIPCSIDSFIDYLENRKFSSFKEDIFENDPERYLSDNGVY